VARAFIDGDVYNELRVHVHVLERPACEQLVVEVPRPLGVALAVVRAQARCSHACRRSFPQRLQTLCPGLIHHSQG
jgi:hypothetical protein